MYRNIAIIAAAAGLLALAAAPLVIGSDHTPRPGIKPLNLRVPGLAVKYLTDDASIEQRVIARGGVYDSAVVDVLERCDPEIREIIEPLAAETIADLNRSGRRGRRAERELLQKAVEVMALCGWDANEGHVVTADY